MLDLIGEVEQAVLEEVKMFRRALCFYRSRAWDKAELLLYKQPRITPKIRLHEVYAERVSHDRNNPPGENWDGVFVFKTK